MNIYIYKRKYEDQHLQTETRHPESEPMIFHSLVQNNQDQIQKITDTI